MNTCVHNLDWSHFRRVLSVVNPDALSVLVHLGYLSYNVETKEARITNYEVQQEFENTIACYSVLHDSEQIFAAKYMPYMPTEEELRQEIEQQKQFFLEQHK